jgi:hypothetical protein
MSKEELDELYFRFNVEVIDESSLVDWKRGPKDQILYDSLLKTEENCRKNSKPMYTGSRMALNFYRMGFCYLPQHGYSKTFIEKALEKDNMVWGPAHRSRGWDMEGAPYKWLRSPFPEISLDMIWEAIEQHRKLDKTGHYYKEFKKAVKKGKGAVESYIILSRLSK